MSETGVASFVEITCASGPLRVARIELYRQDLLEESRALIRAAQRKVEPSGALAGAIGSPGWVAGATLVLGAIEGIAAAAKSSDASAMLVRARNAYLEARRSGRMFDVEEIEGLYLADPRAWRATKEEVSYAANDDDFLIVDDDGDERTHVRWASVSMYRATVQGAPAHPPRSVLLPESNDPARYWLG